MHLPDANALIVPTLGPCRIPSPFRGGRGPFVDDASRVVIPSEVLDLLPVVEAGLPIPSFERAGPRSHIYFDPSDLACGVVTCGGLCPGLNNVIRSLVLSLTHAFGVHRVLGYRYGYAGLAPHGGHEPLPLTLDAVKNIHAFGGTILGSSRGPQPPADMVATLVRDHVRILFAIGGDGTLRGVAALSEEIRRQGRDIAVIGIPKTIDNDIAWTERSFGFATAVEAARSAIASAHEEARGVWNGVGVVRLMGRTAGFIAAHATLANNDANYCLVPEVPVALTGPCGLFTHLGQRLAQKHHAVIVVAEGSGQDLLNTSTERDASGNRRLGDIGVFLHDRIAQHFGAKGVAVAVKYIDPSYLIRSQPANATDAEFCLALGQHAVHAGMAGRTSMMVGFWNHQFTHVPIALVTSTHRRLDPEGECWQRVLEATGQPSFRSDEEVRQP